MIWKGRDRKTLFILGAGATRGAFSHALLNRKRIRAPLNGDFFNVVETFVRAQRDRGGVQARYQRVRQVFRSEFPTRGRWPIGMEEAFSLLYVSKDFPEIYRAPQGRHRQAGSRKEIEDFLRLTFAILTVIESKAASDSLYDRLVANLGPEDCIVTLNYDTMLDSALVRSGWNPEKGYGIGGTSGKIKWRMPKPSTEARLRDVKLLKLHGSLNWYVRASYDQLDSVFRKKPTKIVISQSPRTNETHGFIRQIVPPIYGKFFSHSHWQRLWHLAHKELVNAELLVVIGCSLVDTDFHLNGMIGHAVAVRKKHQRKFDAVVIVNGTTVRRKWLRLLKGSFSAKEKFRRFSGFAETHLS
jgi:hypothetical protein